MRWFWLVCKSALYEGRMEIGDRYQFFCVEAEFGCKLYYEIYRTKSEEVAREEQ